MWFKNLVLYQLDPTFTLDNNALHQQLAEGSFHPCGKTELASLGWVSPLGEGDQLHYPCNGGSIVCARQQERILPASVVNEYVGEQVEKIEHTQDRKVYKKERQTIKEEVITDLLPRAFTRQSHCFAYLDVQDGWLLVDTASANKAQKLTSHLRACLGSLPLSLPKMDTVPGAVMTQWLADDACLASPFQVGHECELRESGDTGGVIRCKNHDLHTEEIQAHLAAGKYVSKIALDWNERISFILQEDWQIKRIKFSEQVTDQAADSGLEDPQDQWIADMTIMTGQLRAMIADLVQVMGAQVSVSD